MDLDSLRGQLDALDELLVPLLCERAQICVEIGKVKGTLGLPLRPPEVRDAQVRAHWIALAGAGPLDAAAINRLYNAITAEEDRVESAYIGEHPSP